ncbi:MAG: 1-acyl-sn-glycerol-3-phosphate acyltransferase [Planctomycetes bacterium]|nr:1-acyl-sn-glycerol-3-phosphate acyltransferase [Planctomycetota bacterium]
MRTAKDGTAPARPATSGPQRSAFWWFLSKWSVRALAKVWFRASYLGVANVPKSGPVLLVANHASYIDPPLVGISAGRWVAFLAQAGLARIAPLRWWMAQMGVTLVDRDQPSKEAIKMVAATLQRGECVGIFPEGTRTRDGTVGSFKSGVEFLVRRTGATVVPVGLDGPSRAFPRGVWLPRPYRCTVRYGAPWSAERVLAPGGVEALRAEVARLANLPLRAELAGTPQVAPGRNLLPADAPSSSAGAGT